MKYLFFAAFFCSTLSLVGVASPVEEDHDLYEENLGLAVQIAIQRHGHATEPVLRAMKKISAEVLRSPRALVDGWLTTQDDAAYSLFELLVRLGIARERFNPQEDFGFTDLFKELAEADAAQPGDALDPIFAQLLMVMPEDYVADVLQHMQPVHVSAADGSAVVLQRDADALRRRLPHVDLDFQDEGAVVDGGDYPAPGCLSTITGLAYLTNDLTNGQLGQWLGWKVKDD